MIRNLKKDMTLEELAQNELLIGLKEQIDYIKEFGNSEPIDIYELCDKVFDKYLENLTHTEGYDTFVENNENSLKIIERNGGKLYNELSIPVDVNFKGIYEETNTSEKFMLYMKFGITETFTNYFKEIDMSTYNINNYEINADNISLGDMMVFHNAISDNLDIERIYSKNDVLKEFNCKQNMELDI